MNSPLILIAETQQDLRSATRDHLEHSGFRVLPALTANDIFSALTTTPVRAVVLVVAKDKAGQKDLSMPEVKERISRMLKGRKEQLLRAAYLTKLRNDAVVVNTLADQLVAAQGKPLASPPKP